jgi:hypothetical protein
MGSLSVFIIYNTKGDINSITFRHWSHKVTYLSFWLHLGKGNKAINLRPNLLSQGN